MNYDIEKKCRIKALFALAILQATQVSIYVFVRNKIVIICALFFFGIITYIIYYGFFLYGDKVDKLESDNRMLKSTIKFSVDNNVINAKKVN